MCLNLINGKKYIGYTSKSLEERRLGHYQKATKSKYTKDIFYFQHALNKYKKEDFEWTILNTVYSLEEAYECEIEMIKKHKSLNPNGYNLTHGGAGARTVSKIRNNISKKLRNNRIEKGPQKYNFSEDFRSILRDRMSKINKMRKDGIMEKAMLGKKHDQESKDKMSITKRNDNKRTWYNFITKEIVVCSQIEINEYTMSKSNRFNHLSRGRRAILSDGWIYVGEKDSYSLDLGVLFDGCPKSHIKKQLSL